LHIFYNSVKFIKNTLRYCGKIKGVILKKKIISIDFDGVLNTYDGHFDEEHIPPIREGAKEFLEELSKNYIIEIFTARNKKFVFLWLQNYNLLQFISEVTNVKNPFTSVFVDDRAINYQGNFLDTINKIKNFKTHWQI
jgi:hypothetical protein